jgi:hypothetical protein
LAVLGLAVAGAAAVVDRRRVVAPQGRLVATPVPRDVEALRR